MIFPTMLVFQVGGLVSGFNESHISGKIICEVLFAGSILAWSIMITRIRDLRRAARTSQRFLAAYRKESHPVSLFLKRERYDSCPLYVVYEKTCKALGSALEARGADPAELFMGGVGSTLQRLGEIQVSSIRNVAQRTMADQAFLLEAWMGILATAVTASPFLGLLGTIWGVMVAFGEMGRTGQAMLADMAPGVSAALITTVVGLLVALPSSIGYNIIAGQIRRIRVKMDNFVQEFLSDIERHFLRE